MSLSWYQLPAPVVFKVSGKDARRYLNNRLSQDLRTAPAGSALFAGALTPQGKVEGLFTVYIESDDLFFLVCDGGERQPLFAALGRYIVADRVSIIDCSSEALVGHVTGESVRLPGIQCFTLPRSRIASTGMDFLALSQTPPDIKATLVAHWGAPITAAEYDMRRFAQGFAQYPEEINSSVILTEAGCREAVSFTKGCYVGQEVMERGDAIGKLPRHLERLVYEGCGTVTSGAPVLGSEKQPIGKVASVFIDPERNQTRSFAYLRSGAYAFGDIIESSGCKGRILLREERGI